MFSGLVPPAPVSQDDSGTEFHQAKAAWNSGARRPSANLHMPGEFETRLVVIRHGHVDGNGGSDDALMVGWTDVPLSPLGHRQIERLRRHLMRRPSFDAIYSSPLSRASQTAQILADAGLGSLHFCPALKEIHCGDADGLPVREVERRFPELWQENLRQVREDFRWPGGESYREFRERCVAAVQSIAARHLSGCVALVTHAGVISQIVGSLRGLSPACWEPFRPGNASVSELRWRGSRGVVVSFDRRLYLSETE